MKLTLDNGDEYELVEINTSIFTMAAYKSENAYIPPFAHTVDLQDEISIIYNVQALRINGKYYAYKPINKNKD